MKQKEFNACVGPFVFGDIFPVNGADIDWRPYLAPYFNSPQEIIPVTGQNAFNTIPAGTSPTPIAAWVYNGLTNRYTPVDVNLRRIGPWRSDLPLMNGQVFSPNLKIRGQFERDWIYDQAFLGDDLYDIDDIDDIDDIGDVGDIESGDGSSGFDGGGGGGGRPGGGVGKFPSNPRGPGYFPWYTPGMYAGPPSA